MGGLEVGGEDGLDLGAELRLEAPERFPWDEVPRLVEAYEAAAPAPLTPAERRALPYTAAVPLYGAALDGFTADPAANLRGRLPFLRHSERLLRHPEAVPG